MKKFILSAAILFGTTLASLAQVPSFNLGIKGGINYSGLKSKESLVDASNIIGYQVGAWARLGGAGLYVQPELYLGSKGGKSPIIIQNDGTEIATSGKVGFTTLDVPLLLGYKIGPNKINGRFMAGPVVSFIVDQKTTTDVAAQNIRDYKNQAWGLQAGAGVDLGSLSLDLRYEAGLSNLSKSPKYDQKQNLFHLSLGFKLL